MRAVSLVALSVARLRSMRLQPAPLQFCRKLRRLSLAWQLIHLLWP